MMPEEIARFLHMNGIGVYDEINGTANPDHNIFIGIMPDGEKIGVPDDLILVNQYAGRQSIHHSLDRVERPGLQVQCRAKYYDDAAKKADEIDKLLDQYEGEIDGIYYNEVRAVQSPFLLKQDDNERIIFVQNFYIDRRII